MAMAPFDPFTAVAGGLLIGLAATFLFWLNGRIAGISGIFGDLLDAGAAERSWRLLFFVGLVVAPFLLAAVGLVMPEPGMPNWFVIVAGGLLVGIGTRLSGGCTSGHGICGLARLSPRSIVATLVFVATAIVTVAIVRHGIGA